MGVMLKQVAHECDIYGPPQRERLWRDLTAHGWTVTIRALPDVRRPDLPMSSGKWMCFMQHKGWGLKNSKFVVGNSVWDCLSKAVDEIVNPAYQA